MESMPRNGGPPERILIRLDEVCERVGVKQSTLRRWWQKGDFPAPRRIGGRPYWSRDDLNRWAEDALGERLYN